MDHTPTTPADDDRPLRVLERTPVADPHKQRLFALVKAAQDEAAGCGAELQAEFGKEHVALIVGCNQFVRLFKGGSQPGAVELLLDSADRSALLAAGFQPSDPEGAVFKLFGWQRFDPMQGPEAPIEDAVRHAFQKARLAKKK